MTEFDDIIKELKRIESSPYTEADHGKNHQTFAKALRYILELLYEE